MLYFFNKNILNYLLDLVCLHKFIFIAAIFSDLFCGGIRFILYHIVMLHIFCIVIIFQ